MPTRTRRPTRKERSARRRAAYYAEQEAKAATPEQRFVAASRAMLGAAKRAGRKACRDLREQIAEHVEEAIERAGLSTASKELYRTKLAAEGTESARLSTAVMCLKSAIKHFPDTERDRTFEFYSNQFRSERGRLDQIGGGR